MKPAKGPEMGRNRTQSPSAGQSRRERLSAGGWAIARPRAFSLDLFSTIRDLTDASLRARIAGLESKLATLDGLTKGGDR